MFNIVNVKNPKFLDVPMVTTLVKRGMAYSPWPDAIDEIRRLVDSPNALVTFIFDKGFPIGFAVSILPQTKLDNVPQVIHIYCRGNPAAREALVDYIGQTLHQLGYERFWAVNYTHKGDEAWAKVLTPKGWKTQPIGSVMEFNKR